MSIKKYVQIITVTMMTFLLVACDATQLASNPPPSPTTEGAIVGATSGAIVGAAAGSAPVGAVIGVAAGSIIGHYISTHRTLVQKIQANGVQFIQIGDNVKLVLPSDKFFIAGTSTLNRRYFSVLDLIAQFISGLEKYSVQVAGYTDNVGSDLRNVALSRQQALNVANYLWDKGVDTRLLSSIGYGSADPIANNDTEQGRAMNRHLEINLRLLYEPDGDF